MTAIDLGTLTTVTWTPGVTGATIVLTVTLPDATTSTPTVTEVAGVYSASVATPQAGRYLLKWSKAAAPAMTYTDMLDVWPADPRFIISVQEAITAIRVSSRVTGSPDFSAADTSDMRLFIAAATPVIEDIVGAVLVRTVTQQASGGKSGVRLHERATTITSVTLDGVALTSGTDYVYDSNAAIIYAGSASAPGSFNPGRMNMTIVYVTGSASIPPNIRTATATLVKRMWQHLMNAQHGFLGDTVDEETVTTQSGYVVPLAVWQLCSPTRRISGVG